MCVFLEIQGNGSFKGRISEERVPKLTDLALPSGSKTTVMLSGFHPFYRYGSLQLTLVVTVFECVIPSKTRLRAFSHKNP
jgi:hypothetical protein